jgi:hypothetical protein
VIILSLFKLSIMRIEKMFLFIAMLCIVLIVGCKKDDDNNNTPKVIPTVTSTNPINTATEIAINGKISATFSVFMDSSTVTLTNFTLKQGSGNVIGTVGYTDKTAKFSPTSNLVANTLYTATITKGVKSKTGQTLANDYVWSFTTGTISDITLPTVTQTNPANNATGVVLNHLIVTTFSEPLDQSTITSLTYLVKQGSLSVSGTITSTGTTATFTPASNLSPNNIYTVTVTTGVKDMAGNAIDRNQTFSFTTGEVADTQLPTVLSTDPQNNALGVERNKVIAITFSEPMDPLTISTSIFTLKQGTTNVLGSVTYSVNTATFIPSSVLAAGLVYNASISTGAKDANGNALAVSNTWSFTTTDAKVAQAVVNLGAAGDYVILAKTAINNISTSAVIGDLGLSPAATTYVTGFSLTDATGYATSAQITGKIFAADMADPTPINLTTAVNNMITAYSDAAGRPTPDFIELGTGNIGGKTLESGLYKWTSSVTIPSDVTISGGANDVWIFQISGDLSMGSAVKIILTGGAQAKNIFWQVAGQATFGTTSHFEGIVLSMTGVNFQTGASMNGRALAQTAVILDGNAITKP